METSGNEQVNTRPCMNEIPGGSAEKKADIPIRISAALITSRRTVEEINSRDCDKQETRGDNQVDGQIVLCATGHIRLPGSNLIPYLLGHHHNPIPVIKEMDRNNQDHRHPTPQMEIIPCGAAEQNRNTIQWILPPLVAANRDV